MSGRSDCRKFAPNIFNKSKCTNCFRQKEEHSAEALESNRASRKISKCGYLFVAPGWDFSNPLYRTKRWQRRWFVLYDDGELTYSLDEHPDTVPQASIDMTSVIEVSDADNITGHPYSVAITSPDRVTFVKGTCREESRWWSDVLTVFPRSKGRHKRNATFPGGQTTSLLQTGTTVRNGNSASRPRYNSCHASGLHTLPRPQPPQCEIQTYAPPPSIDTKGYNDQPVSSASPPTRDKINGDEKARSRRGEQRQRDTWSDTTTNTVIEDVVVPHRSPLLKQYDEQLRDIAASLTRPRSRRALPPHLERPTRDANDTLDARDIHDFIQARGSPDGGAPPPEENSETADAGSAGSGGESGRVELPAERLLHARAGWLQRRSAGGWSRHWFVLRGAALLYFRDPQAEQRGLMDGVIDLNGVARVENLPIVPSNGYSFETETWDGKRYVLSAVTVGIRSNWVSAIRRTAGLPDSPCSPTPPLMREDSLETDNSTGPVTPLTPRSGPFSSDEEYRTASEGGRRDSIDWGDGQPPPSPVLNRTPISKVKDKVRARANHQIAPVPMLTPADDNDEIDAVKTTEITIEPNENEPKSKPHKRSYISTIDKQSIEIDDLRERLKLALTDVSAAERELARLRRIKAESAQREKKMEELVVELQKAEDELAARTSQVESLEVIKCLYNQDKVTWESKLNETQNFLRESTERCEMLTRQLATAQETVQTLQHELTELNDKLHRIVRENDSLYSKINELENSTPRKEKRKTIGSLSELANISMEMDLEALEKGKLIEEYAELRLRFMRAIQEIKVMKKELRESHDIYDELEVTNIKLHNEMKLREECSREEINIMAAKIQDLTQKLTASDKQVRTLKHKIQKTESREKRRSLSLKGRESFSLSKEVEEKLTELENKISLLGPAVPETTTIINTPTKTALPKEKAKTDAKSDSITDEKRMKRLAARLRRKSLDSATCSEPMKMLVRLSSLETKIISALDRRRDLTTSCESLSQTTQRSSESPVLTENSENGSVGNSSQRHLLDRLHSLENIVILSRNKVNECLCQMSTLRSSKTRRSPSPSVDKKPSIRTIEKNLTEVSKTLQECFDKCVVDFESKNDHINDSVMQAVSQLEQQLRTKLLGISKRKAELLEAGELTQRKNLELLAEKLAYEAVLVGRIHEALESSSGSKFFAGLIKSEINETSQLIDVLQGKISGRYTNKPYENRNSLDYLAKILSRKIDIINSSKENADIRKTENIVHSADVEALKKAQKEVARAVVKYKSEKLSELSIALANETLNYVSSTDSDFEQQRANIEAARVREAWAAARDALGAELVQADVARALTRAAQQCEATLNDAKSARLTVSAQQAADLELWWQAAHHHLRAEMDVAVRDIAVKYRDCLNANDRQTPIENSIPNDSRVLLQQLAEVLAHKSLIDARIAVIDGTYQATLYKVGDKKGSEFSDLLQPKQISDNIILSLDSDPTQEAEFIYLFQQFANECRALFSGDCSGSSDDLAKISQYLEQVEHQVREVLKQLKKDECLPINDETINSYPQDSSPLKSIFERCELLKRTVEALFTLVPCKHCKKLQEALDKLKSERSQGETVLQQQAGALAAARKASQQLQAQHERERQQLRERAKRLERRLATLDSEYSQQLENLKAAYHNTIGTDGQGENLRQRYQAEIEQLRALCEKGLLAMESSHRRIVHEMEEKHKAEREQLRLDKEAALAEETRATLAALDAMRKAHESEVKREVDKFKAEFLGRGGAAQLSSRHQQEMEEIKQEILSLSEKYSVKCVESAALEERLVNATQQLAHAQQHIMQLDARNKQLRAHLMAEANDAKCLEPSALAHLIDEPSVHGRPAEGPLWEHLRHLASVWQKANRQETNQNNTNESGTSNDCGEKIENPICKDGKHKKFATLPRAELKRNRCSISEHASLSPLVGMVAERKKLFELDT